MPHFMDRRQFLKTTTWALGAPALLGSIPALAAEPMTVTIPHGVLRGIRNNGVISFKGVPYAADTSGINRFRAPQPVASWGGIRDATRYGFLSPQVVVQSAPIFSWYEQHEGQSEDCCVLNIFTPDLDPSARRPVMFYIHGGGYINGGGGGDALDGTNLANFGDVVVVTVNHRLNAFGYTNLPQVDAYPFTDAANAGHLDLIAALRWVKENILTFGGNPDNVTLFGQSGGGSKIMILLGMPEAKGLFHRAISMSGAAGLNIDPASDMERYVDALLKELKIHRSNLVAMQKVPYQELLAARSRAVLISGLEGARPVIDGCTSFIALCHLRGLQCSLTCL